MQSLVLFLLACGAVSIDRVSIDPKSGHFVDPDGRVLVFHGVNVVQKKAPWHPTLGDFNVNSSLNAEDMANLKKWGFNAVRLGVMWQGVEPSMGNYNATYLKIMRQIVDDLYKHGIYTIVDFHQDSFSPQWCGEGIPNWMVPMLGPVTDNCNGFVSRIAELIGECKTFSSFHIPTDPSTGFPSLDHCLDRTFDAYSRTPELVSAWGNFYANKTLQQKFHDFWSRVATEFAGASGVIGYDLLNEPLNGNFYEEWKRLLPGYLDINILQPMYQSLHDVIRAVDPDAIIMYEPAPFPSTYPSNIPVLHGVHPLGFTEGPAKEDKAHHALSYHVYSCGFAVQDCNRQGDPTSADCEVCDKYARDAITTRNDDVKKLGGGVFLTEFGSCSGSDICIAEIKRVADLADSAMHSWAYWQFKYYDDITTVSGPMEGFYKSDGSLQTAKVTALSRTYATTIAGTPLDVKFDSVTGAFRLRYEVEESLQHLPTEVFLNKELNYGGNLYQIHVMNGNATEKGDNRLHVLPMAAGTVDVAIVRQQLLASTLSDVTTENGVVVKWSSVDAATTGFELSSVGKMIKVYGDSGSLLCSLSMEPSDNEPKRCIVKEGDAHDLLFNYRIELWKQGVGVGHELVQTISSSAFGPLLSKVMRIDWDDSKSDAPTKNSEIVV